KASIALARDEHGRTERDDAHQVAKRLLGQVEATGGDRAAETAAAVDRDEPLACLVPPRRGVRLVRRKTEDATAERASDARAVVRRRRGPRASRMPSAARPAPALLRPERPAGRSPRRTARRRGSAPQPSRRAGRQRPRAERPIPEGG